MTDTVTSTTNGRTYDRVSVTRNSSKSHVCSIYEIANMWLFMDYWKPEECDICGLGHNVHLISGKRVCQNCTQKLLDTFQISSCAKCGDVHFITNLHEHQGHYYCDDCIKSFYAICPVCGKSFLKDNKLLLESGEHICEECASKLHKCSVCGRYTVTYRDNDLNICNTCFDKYYFVCNKCKKVHPNSDKINIDGNPICTKCATKLYNYCPLCKSYHNEVLINGVCKDCHEKWLWKGNSHIYSYHGRDRFWNLRDGSCRVHYLPKENKCYLGYELEINSSYRDNREIVYSLNDVLGGLVHYEYDGSLNSGGFEIISEPMTIKAHMKYWKKYKKMFDVINTRGISPSTHGAGLHVHVSQSVLTEKYIRRLLYIMFVHREKFIAFARRSPNGYCEYPTVSELENNLKMKLIPEDYDNSVKFFKAVYGLNTWKLGHGSHYVFLNLGGHRSSDTKAKCRTIEFRLFKSTTKYLDFMATLQLVDVLINCILTHPMRELVRMSFKDIVKSDYPELNFYLYNMGILGKRSLNQDALEVGRERSTE